MDPYNLAICFGPTLMSVPEGHDQVSCQAHVNELIKTIIIQHENIFPGPRELEGPVYSRGGNTEDYWYDRYHQGDNEWVDIYLWVSMFQSHVLRCLILDSSIWSSLSEICFMEEKMSLVSVESHQLKRNKLVESSYPVVKPSSLILKGKVV